MLNGKGGHPDGEVPPLTVAERIRERRESARTAAEEILTRAADDGRDLTADELVEHRQQLDAERAAADELDRLRDEQIAELRAAATRAPGGPSAPPREPVLAREDSMHSWAQARGLFGESGPDRQPSFDRYLRGLATGDWSGAEEERALSEGTLTAGGHLVPTPLSTQVIDIARNSSVVMRAGATTVPMTAGSMKLARLTGEGTPAWKTENAAITGSDMTFDAVTFTARTLVRLVTLSLELFEDADPSGDGVIARSFGQQMALELDRAALIGSGTPPEPRGLLNQSGVTLTDHGANGALIGPLGTGLGYDFLIDAVAAVRAANFEPNAQITAPRTEASLAKLKEATTNAYAAPPAALAGIPRLPTKQVPIGLTVGTSTDASYVFTGQWDQLLIGIRTGFTLKFLQERYIADTLSYAFLAYLRADVQLAQPAAFVVDRGVRG